MLDDLGDERPVARADFAEDTLVDPDDAADKPVALSRQTHRICVRNLVVNNGDYRNGRTQKTPMLLNEQKGGLSGLIMQNIP